MHKKFEYLARNCGLATILKVLMENVDFIIGENLKILKSHCWPEKSTNIGIEYTKRCGIATFGGVCFLRKVDFVYIVYIVYIVSRPILVDFSGQKWYFKIVRFSPIIKSMFSN